MVGKPTFANRKIEYNTFNGTHNQRRSWKAKESAKEGNLELAGKYPNKKPLQSDSLRQKGSSDRKFSSEEKPKVQVETMEDVSTTIFGRTKENKGEGQSHANNVMQAQPSYEANNLEFPETTSLYFLAKIGKPHVSSL